MRKKKKNLINLKILMMITTIGYKKKFNSIKEEPNLFKTRLEIIKVVYEGDGGMYL